MTSWVSSCWTLWKHFVAGCLVKHHYEEWGIKVFSFNFLLKYPHPHPFNIWKAVNQFVPKQTLSAQRGAGTSSQVLGWGSFLQLRIKIEGWESSSCIINGIEASRRLQWIVCALAVYNSASPRRGMGLSQGSWQTLPTLQLLHSQIIAVWEQKKSDNIKSVARLSRVKFVLIDCSIRPKVGNLYNQGICSEPQNLLVVWNENNLLCYHKRTLLVALFHQLTVINYYNLLVFLHVRTKQKPKLL